MYQEGDQGMTGNGIKTVPSDANEMLDDIITRSRGEIRHTCSPKVTISNVGNLQYDSIKQICSPRTSERRCSPCVTDPRMQNNSPHS